MLDICINYAARFDVIFNEKSQLIVFNPLFPELWIWNKINYF